MAFSFDNFMTGLAGGLASNKGPIGGFGQGWMGAQNAIKAKQDSDMERAAVKKILSGDDTGWQEWGGVNPQAAMSAWNNQQLLNQKNNEVPTSIRELKYIQDHPELKDLYIQSRRGININNNLNPLEKKRIENVATKIDENIAKAQERKALYDRAEQLLDNGVETGGIGGWLSKNYEPSSFMNPEKAEFESIVSKLTPQQRPAGSGTTSDRDMAIYQKATIGLDKKKDTNKSILALGRAMAENDIAHEELRAEWVNQGGSLADFDKIWRKYANEQRIYNDNGTINKDRIDPYEWFATGGSVEQPKTKSKFKIVEIK